MKQRHFELASRAEGEQGIAAFILGDTYTAKKQVVRAWGLSKVEHDPAATVRYASVFGAELVQHRRYKEAFTPLDQAIKIAESNPALGVPNDKVGSPAVVDTRVRTAYLISIFGCRFISPQLR